MDARPQRRGRELVRGAGLIHVLALFIATLLRWHWLAVVGAFVSLAADLVRLVSRETNPAKEAELSGIDVIAIDGPAGVGKSTAAKRLADALGFYFLSSGMIYRAMAWFLMRQGWDGRAAPAVDRLNGLEIRVDGQGGIWVNGQEVSEKLKAEDISSAASVISAVPAVRDRSNAVQRTTIANIGLAGSFPGVILEGRDIGTVVFPNARHKFFLTATEDIRAERRFREVAAKHPESSREAVQQALQERDERDSQRAVAPLVPAADATIVDTSGLNLDDVVAHLIAAVKTPQ